MIVWLPDENGGNEDETQVDSVVEVPSVDGVENALKVFRDEENVDGESTDLSDAQKDIDCDPRKT